MPRNHTQKCVKGKMVLDRLSERHIRRAALGTYEQSRAATVAKGSGGGSKEQLSMPEGAGRCAAWAAEVAAGLENRRLACVAVVEVGVAASGACSMTLLSFHTVPYFYC